MKLQPGSIVKRRLTGFAGLFFYHMGVYVGNDTVVHFGGERKFAQAILLRESLAAFAAGKPVVVHAPPRNPAHARAVCAEAERLYTDTQNCFNHCYDFAFKNCEDFCITTYQVAYA